MRDFLKDPMGFVILILAFVIIFLGMWGCPQYGVWTSELEGKGELRKAEWNKKAAIEEASAIKDSARFLAEAEEIRATGVAKANKIIGNSLRKNEAYLRYLWIQGLHDGNSETIYIPTEANLPILEAQRLKNIEITEQETEDD